MGIRWWAGIGIVVLALFPGWIRGGDAEAAEIKVLSAGAVKAAVADLGEAFGRESGHTVAFTFAPVGVLQRRIAAGEPADLLIMSDAALQEQEQKGVVVAGTKTDIARVGIGVCVREGAPLPDISTPEALKQAILAAKSLVYMDPSRGATSGVYFAGVLERLGIGEAVKGKTLLWQDGSSAEPVAKGEADLCVQQMSEILPVKGVRLVGPLPREVQKVTTYSAGLATAAAAPDAAKAFLAYLLGPAAKAKFAAVGLDYRE
jgi:molybdate transport system substrate-binding protein